MYIIYKYLNIYIYQFKKHGKCLLLDILFCIFININYIYIYTHTLCLCTQQKQKSHLLNSLQSSLFFSSLVDSSVFKPFVFFQKLFGGNLKIYPGRTSTYMYACALQTIWKLLF